MIDYKWKDQQRTEVKKVIDRTWDVHYRIKMAHSAVCLWEIQEVIEAIREKLSKIGSEINFKQLAQEDLETYGRPEHGY